MSNVRTILNDNRTVAWGVVGGVALLAVLIVGMQRGGPGGEAAYFFDLSTGELVERWSSTMSPDPDAPGTFVYPDGEAGSVVRATLLACGDRPVDLREGMTVEQIRAAGAILVSVSRYPTQAAPYIARLKHGETLSPDEVERYADVKPLLGPPDGSAWHPTGSNAASRLMAAASDFCGGETPRFVKP